MKITKKIFVNMILLFMILLTIESVVAVPTAEIEVVPAEPEQLDTVTFTATITGEEEVEEVILEVIECNIEDICYNPVDVTMEPVDNEYIAELTLTHDDATYIQYKCIITAEGETTETEFFKTDLAITSDNGDENGNDDNNGSPGFELLVFIISLFVVIVIITRKKR
jgi:hypothetical protein